MGIYLYGPSKTKKHMPKMGIYLYGPSKTKKHMPIDG
ncbi:uncharacterized protein G2W53_025495 [Senna tora]|uniref:Uncharacterized protein n=1 Tax=Senna tora TaxID=362788 RepID=A0A834WE90_9FABA|nr:uncharacterized protein G2W53_025495 [Senna tora]